MNPIRAISAPKRLVGRRHHAYSPVPMNDQQITRPMTTTGRGRPMWSDEATSALRRPDETPANATLTSARRRPVKESSWSRSPDNSALGTKPRAPERKTSGPKSDESRLETRITTGPSALPVRRAATSNPSMSGSCTSSSTTSGWSRPASVSADAPSAASPTTSKPSASRRTRAVARNDGWSSTIRTR